MSVKPKPATACQRSGSNISEIMRPIVAEPAFQGSGHVGFGARPGEVAVGADQDCVQVFPVGVGGGEVGLAQDDELGGVQEVVEGAAGGQVQVGDAVAGLGAVAGGRRVGDAQAGQADG